MLCCVVLCCVVLCCVVLCCVVLCCVVLCCVVLCCVGWRLQAPGTLFFYWVGFREMAWWLVCWFHGEGGLVSWSVDRLNWVIGLVGTRNWLTGLVGLLGFCAAKAGPSVRLFRYGFFRELIGWLVGVVG